MQTTNDENVFQSIVGALKQTLTDQNFTPAELERSGSDPRAAQQTTSNDYAAQELLTMLTRSAKPQSAKSTGANETSRPADPPVNAFTDIAELVTRTKAAIPPSVPVESNRTAQSRAKQDSGSSVGSTILKTVGLATGIGPIAAGLMSLFGFGGGKKQPDPEPILYTPPSALSVEAGLTSDRGFADINYSDGGIARNLDGRRATNPVSSQAPTVQVTVNAMDSRSFLDRSDDIAKAVREAMLNSHSLNDVISDL